MLLDFSVRMRTGALAVTWPFWAIDDKGQVAESRKKLINLVGNRASEKNHFGVHSENVYVNKCLCLITDSTSSEAKSSEGSIFGQVGIRRSISAKMDAKICQKKFHIKSAFYKTAGLANQLKVKLGVQS